MNLTIRDAEPADAEGVIGILNPIIEARRHTAFSEPFSVDVEREYIVNFPARGVWKVAIRPADGCLVGFQVLEPFGPYTRAFDHVGTLGTYVDLRQRRQGIATALFAVTLKPPSARDTRRSSHSC
jgi:L-amino acid N-acyltransferase YncA